LSRVEDAGAPAAPFEEDEADEEEEWDGAVPGGGLVLVRPPPLVLNTIFSFFCGGRSLGEPLTVALAAAFVLEAAAAAPRPLLLLLPLLLELLLSPFFLAGVFIFNADAAAPPAPVAFACGVALAAAAFLGVGPDPPFSQEVRNFLSSWSNAFDSLVTLAYRGLLGPL